MKYYKIGDLVYMLRADNQTALLLVSSGKAVQQNVSYESVKALVDAGQAREISAADAKAAQQAAGRTYASAGGVPQGIWRDASGYVYEVQSGSITIYKKSGAKWKTVDKSSSDWNTLYTNLSNDYKAGGLTKTDAPSASSGTAFQPSSYSTPAPVTPSAPEPVVAPLTKQWWFWPAIGTGTLLLGVGIYWAVFAED